MKKQKLGGAILTLCISLLLGLGGYALSQSSNTISFINVQATSTVQVQQEETIEQEVKRRSEEARKQALTLLQDKQNLDRIKQEYLEASEKYTDDMTAFSLAGNGALELYSTIAGDRGLLNNVTE